jgi:hypothetical protein
MQGRKPAASAAVAVGARQNARQANQVSIIAKYVTTLQVWASENDVISTAAATWKMC